MATGKEDQKMTSRTSIAALFFIAGLVGAVSSAIAAEALATPVLTHTPYEEFAPMHGLDGGEITGTTSPGIPLTVGSNGRPRAYVPFDVCGPGSWRDETMTVVICE
jgi:hypothetical protein